MERYYLQYDRRFGTWTVTAGKSEAGTFRTWAAAQSLANRLNGEAVR